VSDLDDLDLHRRLGARLNNHTWDLIEGDLDREDPVARDDLLYGAYAATYHWMQAGTAIHHARGEHLISRAALRIGDARTALRHARRCLELIDAHLDEAEDWDLAFAFEALARAHAALGDLERGQKRLDKAIVLGRAIKDQEDRDAFLAELAKGEWFGLDPGGPSTSNEVTREGT
jgi:hypothetical protein